MTDARLPVVIVGSGLAAWTVARELRKLDKTRELRIVTRDAGHYYSKPMLSNALAAGKTAAQLVNTPAAQMAQQTAVRLHAHTAALSIDRDRRVVHTSDGPIEYGQLVLATGAEPIRVALDGDAAGDVLSVNDLDDYALFRERLAHAAPVVILGAGLIGCEFANDLAQAGHTVEIIDPGPQVLGRLVPEPAAALLQRSLERVGVRFHLKKSALSVERDRGQLRLQLSDDRRLNASLVLSAIGLRPRTDLARNAGLDTDRGIRVDASLRTSDQQIFALGDGAEYEGVVLPYVMPIMHAARTLAAQLVGSNVHVRFPPMPVVVKTPVAPVVAVPPPATLEPRWQHTTSESGIESRCLSADGRLLGFALVGDAIARKSGLLAALGESR